MSKRERVVEVEWVDSTTRGSWRDKEEYRTHTPMVCRSVGYLFRRDKDAIVLVQSLGTEAADEALTAIAIPRGCVKSYRVLRAGPKG